MDAHSLYFEFGRVYSTFGSVGYRQIYILDITLVCIITDIFMPWTLQTSEKVWCAFSFVQYMRSIRHDPPQLRCGINISQCVVERRGQHCSRHEFFESRQTQ